MILLDTSVVVDWLRYKDAKVAWHIGRSPLVVCGVTRTEILHGARDAGHRSSLAQSLDMFLQVDFQPRFWDEAGDLAATLRSCGFALPFADVLIAAVAIGTSLPLWTRDKHFTEMSQAIPALKLFVDSP